MKSISFFLHLCMCIIIGAVLLSCENNRPMPEPADSAVYIVKFTKPSDVNNLIVTDYGWEHFILMRGNCCSANFLKNTSGRDWIYEFPSIEDRIPYIELADGWYLIDWTWQYYPYNGKVLLTDVTWDNYHGEHLFDRSISYISGDDIYEKKEIEIGKLVNYLYPDGNYPTFKYNSIMLNEFRYFHTLYGGRYSCEGKALPYLGNEGECVCSRVSEMDTLWEFIRQQLITVIKNGDLDNLPSADFQKLLGNVK